MDVQGMLFVITFCLLVMTNGAPVTSPLDDIVVPISKDGCESKCGNLSVPFPFGMGRSYCFLDQWFEVMCNKSVIPPRLVLKHLQLEVINISMVDNRRYYHEYDNEILVKGPISFSNCRDNETRKAINLTGAPFSFSNENLFVAVSCGIRAELNSSSGNVFTQIRCPSDCSPTDNTNTNKTSYSILCDGTDCCQTSIPSILDSYEISFEGTTDSDECKFAFVTSSYFWSDYKNGSTSIMAIRDMDYVPLTLNWILPSSYFDILNGEEDKLTGSYCYNRSTIYSSSDSSDGMELQCYCHGGLRGNPYLLGGCTQDINECEDLPGHGWCGPGSTCVNTHGGYHCSYRRKFLIIGFGSSFGALLLLFGLWGTYKGIKKRRETKRKRKFFKQNGGLLLQQQLSSGDGNIEKTKLFDSNELIKATDKFSDDRILGQGGQGTVYKGMLEDGKIVAVKKSKIVDETKLSEFINEVVVLSQINHRNVVQLLGCCLETEVPILVYEFIPNGTLSEYIHKRNDEFPFTWKMRIRIASEVAGALSYLHSAAAFPIYHRDIKSTNILLDDKYRAKVADFGTSRTISLEQTHLTTLVYGTFGYLDPEYFQSSQFTEKSDVYSFGVVLVELLTGQKAICASRAEDGRNLATYFTMSMEANALFDILDPQVLEDGPKEEIMLIASLALTCLSLSGRNRPTMKEVAMELEGLQKIERSEAHSHAQRNHEEIELVGTELIGPWDSSTSMSIGRSDLDTTIHSSQLQEIPLLSLERR